MEEMVETSGLKEDILIVQGPKIPLSNIDVTSNDKVDATRSESESNNAANAESNTIGDKEIFDLQQLNGATGNDITETVDNENINRHITDPNQAENIDKSSPHPSSESTKPCLNDVSEVTEALESDTISKRADLKAIDFKVKTDLTNVGGEKSKVIPKKESSKQIAKTESEIFADKILSIAEKVKLKSNERAAKVKSSDKQNETATGSEADSSDETLMEAHPKPATVKVKTNLDSVASKGNSSAESSPRSASRYMNKLKQSCLGGQPVMAGVRRPAETNNNRGSKVKAEIAAEVNRKRKLGAAESKGSEEALIKKKKVEKSEILSVSLLPPRPQLSRYSSQLEYLEKMTLHTLWKNSASWPFQTPVLSQGFDVPDYLEIVKRPMDLGTIKRRLAQRFYTTGEECIRDFNLVFSNCYTYNKPHTDIWAMCQQLERAFMNSLAHMPQQLRLRPGLRVGMKLEVEDRANDLVCCATVAALSSDMIRVHFDGWEDDYDFWCHPWASIVHPVGYCLENEVALSPPRTCKNIKKFTWEDYMRRHKTVPAPARCLKPNMVPYGFAIGWKLEAEDRTENLVCCATVVQIRDCDLRIHYDGWDNEFDFWCHPHADNIHPVGWCKENGLTLSPPKDWKSVEKFSWDAYLKRTHSLPVPRAAFDKRKGYATSASSLKPLTPEPAEEEEPSRDHDVTSPSPPVAKRKPPSRQSITPTESPSVASKKKLDSPSVDSKKKLEKDKVGSKRELSADTNRTRSETPTNRRKMAVEAAEKQNAATAKPLKLAEKAALSQQSEKGTPRMAEKPPRSAEKITPPPREAPKRQHVIPARYQDVSPPEPKARRVSTSTSVTPSPPALSVKGASSSVLDGASQKRRTAKLPTVEVSPMQSTQSSRSMVKQKQLTSPLSQSSTTKTRSDSLESSRAQLKSILEGLSSQVTGASKSSASAEQTTSSPTTPPKRSLRQLIIPTVTSSAQSTMLSPIESSVIQIAPISPPSRTVAIVPNQSLGVPISRGLTSPLSSLSNSPLFSQNIPNNSVLSVSIHRTSDGKKMCLSPKQNRETPYIQPKAQHQVRPTVSNATLQKMRILRAQAAEAIANSKQRGHVTPIIAQNSTKTYTIRGGTISNNAVPTTPPITIVPDNSMDSSSGDASGAISSLQQLVTPIEITPICSEPDPESTRSTPIQMTSSTSSQQPEMRVPERINSILSNVQMLGESDVRNVLQMAASRLSAHAQIDLAQMLLRWNNDVLPPRVPGCPCLSYKASDRAREEQAAHGSGSYSGGSNESSAKGPNEG